MRLFYVSTLALGLTLGAFTASAQDTTTPTPTPTPTTTSTTPTPTPPPIVPVAPVVVAVVKSDDEQEPLRLGRLIEVEADHARGKRYGSAALQMVGGATGIILGSLPFALHRDPLTDYTALDILSVTAMVFGGVTMIGGLIDLFINSPMERLFDAYAPIAIDKTIAPRERLRRGEVLLAAMSEAEHRSRVAQGVSSFITAALGAGLAIFIAADKDIAIDDVSRVILSASGAAIAIASISSGIVSILFERGIAENMWDYWQATHGTVVVHTEAAVKFHPIVAPLPGGATAGFSLTF